jgi:antitoxin MazE
MQTRVGKWGNSLALSIPRSFADEIGLREDVLVELSVAGAKLIIQPVSPEPLTLDELLRGVTADNLHGEWDTGPAVGREIW